MRQARTWKQNPDNQPSSRPNSLSTQGSSASIKSEVPIKWEVPKPAANGIQAHRKAKHVPRGYISLNEHSIPSQYSHFDHHLETSGFTRELGLLPSCKRRRTACAQAYLASQEANASAGVTDAQQEPSRALPTSSAGPMVTTEAAELDARGTDDTRAGTIAAGERHMDSLKDGNSSSTHYAAGHAAGKCFKGSDVVSQNGSDHSSSDRLHVPDGREQRAMNRAAKQQHTRMQLQESHAAPAGRLSKRKGTPHRSAYC